MSNQYPRGPIQDPRINAVIERLQAARRPGGGGPRGNRSASRDPHNYAEQGFSITPDQGELICSAAALAPRGLPSSRPRSACRRSISLPPCATMAVAS